MVLAQVCSCSRESPGSVVCGSRSTAHRCRSPTESCSRISKRRLARTGVDPATTCDRGHRDRRDLDMARAHALLRGRAGAWLRSCTGRLRRGFWLLPIPQAPAVQLPEDRRRLHPCLPDSPKDQLVVKALVGSPAEWASRRSPSSSATRRRSSCCAITVSTTPRDFEVGRPQPAVSRSPFSRPYLGWGNWARIAASQTRSGVSLRCRSTAAPRRSPAPRGRRGARSPSRSPSRRVRAAAEVAHRAFIDTRGDVETAALNSA